LPLALVVDVFVAPMVAGPPLVLLVLTELVESSLVELDCITVVLLPTTDTDCVVVGPTVVSPPPPLVLPPLFSSSVFPSCSSS
jgi:hypothetical protein